METKTKIGILQYIAAKGAKGIKFEDEPEVWYNPIDTARDQVDPAFKGKTVEIVLTGNKNEFSSMVLLDKKPKQKEEPKIIEERIGQTTTEESFPIVNDELLEQVPRDSPTEEEIRNEVIYGKNPLEMMIDSRVQDIMNKRYTKEIYKEMETTQLETATKGPHKLTYASWAEAWGTLKRIHPTATFKVHENREEMPIFYDNKNPDMGAFVKISVTILGLTHTVHLPVLNFSNKSIKVSELTTFNVNTSIQRALAKGIALHGLGLYVYKGEDYPEENK